MVNTRDHGAELLPLLLFETDDDEYALCNLEDPVEELVVATAYPEIVTCDVIEATGGVVEHGHLMMEGESDATTMAHLLNETYVIGA